MSTGTPATGGWVTFPGGSFTSDPASNASLAGVTLYGMTYMPALGKWIPVPRSWVSPDGLKYAYPVESAIRIVRVGQPTLVLPCPNPTFSSPSHYWRVLVTLNAGVYARPPDPAGAFPEPFAGLWWIPFAGTPREIISSGYWTASDGLYAYGSMSWYMTGGEANTILRLDLATGSTTPIFYQPGTFATAKGVDAAGNALVAAAEQGGQRRVYLWAVGPTAIDYLHVATSGTTDATTFRVNSVVPDVMGTWVSTTEGLYLYSAAGGFELASPVKGTLASALKK